MIIKVRCRMRVISSMVLVLTLACTNAPAASPGPADSPWRNTHQSPDERAAALVDAMTLEEKIQLLHGSFGSAFAGGQVPPGALGGEGFVPGIPRLGIPHLQLIDGGLGLTNFGKRPHGQATALPGSLALAASFDPALAYEFGTVVGRETRQQGFNVLLGPGVNLQREGANGRNFEYLGEDPWLAGKMVAAQAKAVQDQGVIATIKHFAVNTQETDRRGINAVIDERALREADLLPFEIGIKESGVGSVMCAYNRVNGVYACEHDEMLNRILKQEWGFKGWVMSDWDATHSTAVAANAGLDQEFFANRYFGQALADALAQGKVTRSRVDDMVLRILRTMFAVGVIDNPPVVAANRDVEAHLAVAQKVAEQGSVLLRNENDVLPLAPARLRSIAIIGKRADMAVAAGGGSSQVDAIGGTLIDAPPPGTTDGFALLFPPAWHPSSPLKAIQAKARNAQVRFDSGNDPAAAATLAAASDIAIVFAYEHRREGIDVPELRLPDNQDALIEAVAAVNPRTIVVLETGGPVLTPWADKVAAMLAVWYPGNRGAEAIANILFGDVNPSGKLPVTFPRALADLPRSSIVGYPDPPDPQVASLPPRMLDVGLDEGLRVGYKWFDAEHKTPRFPFGFGLSYTTFAYSSLQAVAGNAVKVSFNLRNVGKRSGAEIAQVYVGFPDDAGEPPRRLAGWTRVQLRPGETRRVTVTLDSLALSIWDVGQKRWRVPAGRYQILVGTSSRSLPLRQAITLEGR